jgi:3-deoxy-D-arabino-heptulosonate 7-phosphate (DAHP) synthase class II
MPEGFPALSKNQIGKNRREFLVKSDFKIQYNSVEVKLDEGFAFVNAIAETTEKDLKSEEIVIKTSRDFFVFKKEEKEWKIFRYLFNNVKFIES